MWQLALMAAQMYLGIVTQPRPKKVTFEEFLDQNKGDETRPIPYIRGKWQTSPQRIWLGDYSTRAIERDSHWTDYLFFGVGLSALLDFITVAYSYHVGQVLALTWGPINRVSNVWVDDIGVAVIPATDNAGGGIMLDHPDAFGGNQPPGQGGIAGYCDILPGTYTQPVNPYLARIEGIVPALRGIAALVIRGRTGYDNWGYFSAAGVGGAPQLREWKVEVMAWPDNFGTGFHRLPDDSYNRIDALYEWVTKPDYGAQYPAENIHLPSWLEAQATVYAEDNGFSGEINTGGNVGEIVDQLKASIDAEMYEHPRDGLKLKLIRKDYSLPSLTVLDESNVNSVEEYTPGDYADSYNKVILNYINADNNYTPRPAIYEDPANYHLQRRVATREVNYPGVAHAELTQRLVTRDGRVLGQPWPPLTLNASEAGRHLWPGDVYKFEWPNPLLSKIIRVASRTPSTSYDGEKNFRLQGVEDQYSTGLSTFGTPSGTGHTNPAGTFADAPPSAAWDTVLYPPNGLIKGNATGLNPVTSASVEELTKTIIGGIIFTEHAAGQYARLYVTEPGGVQTLSPVKLLPDADNKAMILWPSIVEGDYIFCVETYSHTGVTNGVKVCATLEIEGASASPSASVSPSSSASRSVSPSSSASPSAGASPSSSVSPSASRSPSSSASPSAGPGTRFYFPSTGTPAISPAYSSSWNKTSDAIRRNLVTTRINSARLNKSSSVVTSSSSEQFILTGQHVSAPLAAQLLLGTIKGQFPCRTGGTTVQGTLAILIKVMSGDGATERGVLLSISASVNTATPPRFIVSSQYGNRSFRDVLDSTDLTLDPMSCLAGDVIVIETGFRELSTSPTSAGFLTYGDVDTVDAPEDETTDWANTFQDNAWIEFSSEPVFQ